jgi:ferritin-like protein
MAHEGYHEPPDQLPEPARDFHRAIVSLMEELEAVDWYYQRAGATRDATLREVLLHNAHEEVEHGMMTLEWLRRADPVFDRNAREYLFREGSIVQAEKAARGDTAAATDATASSRDPAPATRVPARTTIGSLRPSAEGVR